MTASSPFRTFPRSFGAVAIGLSLLVSCSEPDLHTRDAITALYCTLESADSSEATVTLYYEDRDGNGGRSPIIIGGQLKAHTLYKGTLHMRFASEEEAEGPKHGGVGLGITKRPTNHQVFYTPSPELDMTVAYSDKDSLGSPIGIATRITTGAADTGTLTIVIRYDLDKFAPGVAEGDMTHAGGKNDIEVVFGVETVGTEAE